MKVYVVGKKEALSYIAMAFLLILCGASFAHLYLEDPGTKSAAASVRQLPIYSVETEEKKKLPSALTRLPARMIQIS
ncbi:MAG: hypothetical protein ACLR23_23480 [Clostridia bacterium]